MQLNRVQATIENMGKGRSSRYQSNQLQKGEDRIGFRKAVPEDRTLSDEQTTQISDRCEEQAKGDEQRVNMDLEFPILGNRRAIHTLGSLVQNNQQISWKDKVISPNTKIGRPLKYVAPIVENGQPIV